MYELVSVGDLPLPQASPNPSNKRERDSDSPLNAEASNANTSPVMEVSRVIAGSRRVSGARKAMQKLREQSLQPKSEFQLPIHTHDLGKIPLYPIAEYPAGVSPSLMDEGQTGGSNEKQPIHRHWVEPAAFGYLNAPIIAPTAPPMPAGGSMVGNMEGGGTSLFSVDPLVYDDMMTNFGGDLYASAIASGSGGHAFGNLLGSGFGLSSLPQSQPGPQAQGHQQQLNQSMMMNMAGVDALANPDTLAMWTNAPNGFEWVPF